MTGCAGRRIALTHLATPLPRSPLATISSAAPMPTAVATNSKKPSAATNSTFNRGFNQGYARCCPLSPTLTSKIQSLIPLTFRIPQQKIPQEEIPQQAMPQPLSIYLGSQIPWQAIVGHCPQMPRPLRPPCAFPQPPLTLSVTLFHTTTQRRETRLTLPRTKSRTRCHMRRTLQQHSSRGIPITAVLSAMVSAILVAGAS